MHSPALADFSASLEKLRAFIEQENFEGYDPYDTLNSPIPFERLGKWTPILAIQFQKRNPINIRPLLGIEKERNPKAIGLLLEGYSRLISAGHGQFLPVADSLFEWLKQNVSPGYSGACWGYNFDWASPEKVVKKGTPSAVVTGFVARGISCYVKATGSEEASRLLASACEFVVHDLPTTDFASGCCISYTPIKRDVCYNASLLAAEALCRGYEVTGRGDYLSLAKRAADFVVDQQHDDGRWNYSLNEETDVERIQIDFHQGFIIDSLNAVVELGQLSDPVYQQAIVRGTRFYREQQFLPDGRALWRLPRQWPVEIHNQAQGIITLSQAGGLNLEYPAFAATIANWTIENMQRSDGAFRYRIGRWFRNSIPFMRWSQAWMFVAFVVLLEQREDDA